MKIGNIEIKSRLVLAPMAGVTDLAFRTICREMGAGLVYTEMVSAKALVYSARDNFTDNKTCSLLQASRFEHPIAAQIFGSDPQCMGEAAAIAAQISKADIIDINMGCPVGKVVKSGDGCALMQDPDKAMKIIRCVINSVSCPVTIKIRKGWDKGNVNAVEFSKAAEDTGVSAIAVHGRTRTQMYAGVADWDIIREVKNAVKIPVITNGDIWEALDVKRILNYTGADFAMIARGAMGNPWIFQQADAIINGYEPAEQPDINTRVDTALKQFEMAARYKSEKIVCLEARKHFMWYLRGVPHTAPFKLRITKAETLNDFHNITEEIKLRYS